MYPGLVDEAVGNSTVLLKRTMPGAQWFVGAELNYAQYLLGNAQDERPALLFQSERQPLHEVTWAELMSEGSSALRNSSVRSASNAAIE